jgi:formiminotetrahydrofolate cyclodeaminase
MNEFLDELASSSPAPGGGSVSALCGSLGAALSSMVCNLTLGKKGYEKAGPELRQVLEESEELRHGLFNLIEDDARAFNRVMAAFKLPKDTEEQKNERSEAIQDALKEAVEVPMQVSRQCLSVLKLSRVVALTGNKNSVTDAGVSALVARAGLQGALLNAKVNLASIRDDSFKQKVLEEAALLEDESSRVALEALEIVSNQLRT